MRKFPFQMQSDSMDCGPTCLQMILRYYGKEISIQTIRKKTKIGENGVTLLGISEAAENMGFKTRSIIIEYELLINKAPLPCILHWNHNHFVVLYKIVKNKLFVADPSIGLIQLIPTDFITHWMGNKNKKQQEGVALVLEPSKTFQSLISM